MVVATPDDLFALESTLLNIPGTVPLAKRFRALFTLKAVGNDDAVRIISKGKSPFLSIQSTPA